MPNAVYPLLLLMVVYVLGAAFFKSELFGHALLLAFAMALMLVINHYSELYVWGLAYQARSPWLRSFLANSAITVASIAPAVILGLVWVVRERVQSFALYAVAIATATSGLATAYGEIARLAPYPARLRRPVRGGRRRGAGRPQHRRPAQGPPTPNHSAAGAPRRLGAPRRERLAPHRRGQALVQKGRDHHRRGLSPRLKAQVRRQGAPAPLRRQ